MNDLPSCLKHSEVILFADDTTLYASSKIIVQLYDNINSDLADLIEWFRANKLSLNTRKTHYMLFSPVREGGGGIRGSWILEFRFFRVSDLRSLILFS